MVAIVCNTNSLPSRFPASIAAVAADPIRQLVYSTPVTSVRARPPITPIYYFSSITFKLLVSSNTELFPIVNIITQTPPVQDLTFST
jgi:hypothetical protein